jgi:hypothetical protein
VKKVKAKQVVEVVLNELGGRGGFDHWWDNIDEDIQDEIREKLVKLVMEVDT